MGPSSHLVIIGPTNAGKTTAGKFIAKNTDIRHIEASVILRELLAAREMEFNYSNIRVFFRRNHDSRVAEQIVELIATRGWPNTVITGLRSPSELEYINCQLPNVVVVEIIAPRETRLRRALNYQKAPRDEIRDVFFEKESLGQELGLERTLDTYPDHQITNTGPRSQLYDQLSNLPVDVFAASEEIRHEGYNRGYQP